MHSLRRISVSLGLGAFLLLGCSATSPAVDLTPAPDRLQVSGDLPSPGTWTVDQLEALGGEDLEWVFRDAAHRYRGLRVDRLLQHAGFTPGPGGPSLAPRDRRPGWRSVLIATARDGFRAVFTCAELMPEMGCTRAYVVWRRDGEALSEHEGPIRLIVTTDQKGSRSARQLVELRVADAGTL